MKTISRVYFDSFDYPVNMLNIPFFEKAKTVEIEPPFRVGRGLVFRIPFTFRAYVVGFLGKPREINEETALLEAMWARNIDLKSLDLEV